MSEEAQADIQKYGYNPKDMPDCFLPDNFDEVFQRIGIHGTRPHRTGCLVYFSLPTIQPTTKGGCMCWSCICALKLRDTLPSSS